MSDEHPRTDSADERMAEVRRAIPAAPSMVGLREELISEVLVAVFEGFEHGQCEAFWEPAWGEIIASRAADQCLALLARGRE